MKRVLVITYYWPPSGGAGVQRWLKFVKYLRDFGWEPLVYTPLNPEMPVVDKSLEKDVPEGITVIKRKIWEPYSVYKILSGKKNERINAAFLNESGRKSRLNKFFVWLRGNFFIPDARCFWIKPSVNFLSKYLNQHSVQVIISTGPPHSMHLIAQGVKLKNPEIKWLADFRDPWTNIDFYDELMLSKIADKKHRRLERSVLKNCDSVVSVGNTLKKELALLSEGEDDRKFHVITNGFDEEDISRGNIEDDEKFTITHIGTLVKTRNPLVLWKVLKELIINNKRFAEQLEIKLVGNVDSEVIESIKQAGLTAYLKKISHVPHTEVTKMQKQSRVNLLLVNNTPNAKGILTGKFFEYLGAGKPILAIGPPDGDLADILKETKAGLISDFNDAETLKKNILNLFSGNIPKPDEYRIKDYSRKNLTKKLASILNNLVE